MQWRGKEHGGATQDPFGHEGRNAMAFELDVDCLETELSSFYIEHVCTVKPATRVAV